MLRLALVLFLVAIVAAIFGFGLVANVAFEAGKILAIIFLVLALVALFFGYRGRAGI